VESRGLTYLAVTPEAKNMISTFFFGMNKVNGGASLDHALWFHDEFRADEWLLFSVEAERVRGGRGLARGRFYTRDGRLVASTMQEGLMRFLEPL